jgi:CheY-like chemotaxis protein
MNQPKILGKRILLAEDQAEVRHTLKLLLNLDDHTVTEASNGHEALDLYAPGRFDLVITDFSMPGMFGDELAQNIKRLSPEQRVVMVTAYAEKAVSRHNPVDAILNKPFSFQQLRDVVAKVLSEK